MTQRRIYVETTIPSFYFEVRTEAEMVARRRWTRDWWEVASQRDELVTSAAVLDELRKGDFEARDDCLRLISPLTALAIDAAILEIASAYVRHRLMPSDPGGDALHLALASYHRCDYLVTWNCRHLANVNKFDHIRRVNNLLGLFVPALATPLECLEGSDDV